MNEPQAAITVRRNGSTGRVAMITGSQIRAARALLGWTSQQLASASGIHYATISRAEQSEGIPGIRTTSLDTLRRALEDAGIIFLCADGGPGVRLRE